MCAWILADSVIFDPVDQSLTMLDGSKKNLSIREVLLLNALLQKESDKRRLIDIVWPNTIVSDSSYHKLLFELRTNLQAMGLPPDAIKTIPRRGCSINISAVEVPDASFPFQSSTAQPHELKDGGTDQRLNQDCKSPKNRMLPRIIAVSHRLNTDAITNIPPSSSRRGVFFEKKYLACAIAISVILSFFIFYAVLAASFGEMTVYTVNGAIKNKKTYSLNKDSAPWGGEILNLPFSTGFSYKSGNDVVYFLCKGKRFNNCKNHVYILH